jgi:hypothetical protein
MVDPGQIWTGTLQQLRLQMTAATFDAWLSGSQVLDQDGSTWVIGVRRAAAVDWLTQRLMPVVQRSLDYFAGGPTTIRFVHACPQLPCHGQEVEHREAAAGDQVLLEAVREERVTIRDDGASLVWTDFYIKLKVAFRSNGLRMLKGAKLSVFLCLALHLDRDGTARPGIEAIMKETDYSRSVVCNALDELEDLGLIAKQPAGRGADRYEVKGYAWYGTRPAPAFWEVGRS